MKRQTLHTLFGCLSALLLTFLGWQWAQLHALQSLSNALASIPTELSDRDAVTLPKEFTNLPDVQLAIANAVSRGNNLEQAELIYNELIRQHPHSATGQSALFNLGNAYLRQGMDANTPANQTLPMLELAKQRYRDLLRMQPDHWDARYNLERALQLAPENSNSSERDKIPPVKSVRVIVPGFEKQDLP